jgi:hypothetical protein
VDVLVTAFPPRDCVPAVLCPIHKPHIEVAKALPCKAERKKKSEASPLKGQLPASKAEVRNICDTASNVTENKAKKSHPQQQ